MAEDTSIEELVEDFGLFDDWQDRYRYIIDLGRKLPALDDQFRTETYKVSGCMSQVWMVPRLTDDPPGRIEFDADSDAHIVKGLIALLRRIYVGRSPEEVLAIDIEDVFARIGLAEHLSPGRRNGFFSMVERLKASARAHAA